MKELDIFPYDKIPRLGRRIPITKRPVFRIEGSMMHVIRHLTPLGVSVLLGVAFELTPLRADERGVAPEAATKISLPELLEETRRANPDLAALTAQAESSELEVDTQFYLPPPMIGIGSMGMNGPLTSDGHMQTSYQLSQQIPFPTKIIRRKDALRHAGAAARSSAQARWLELRAEVRKAYFDYWKAHERQDLLKERVRVIADHQRRLRAGSLSTQLMQAHLAASETDIALAKTEIETATQEETIARGELNALMGKDAFAPLGPPAEPPLSALPSAPTLETIENISRNHPGVRESQARLQAAESSKSAAQSEYLPDFTVSYRRNLNTSLAADVSNSEVMLGVSLPFAYFWQPKATARASAARETQAQAQLIAKQNSLRLQLLKSYVEASSLRSQYLHFTESVLPSSARRGRIAHGIAPTDMEALAEHREAMERPVELRLRALELRTGFEKALADYESLDGSK